MRNKIKEIMNKEEGFTLVELLAVIVILGIIVAIAIPAVGGVMDRAGSDADDAENALVEDAARLYDIENDIPVGEAGTENAGITVSDLQAAGYLEERGEEGSLPSGTVYKVPVTEADGDATVTNGHTYNFVPDQN